MVDHSRWIYLHKKHCSDPGNCEVCWLIAECDRLREIERIASVAVTACRAGMEPLIEDGIRSLTFAAASDQFSAAWRDLRRCVETGE
jgi:hypothetical protein